MVAGWGVAGGQMREVLLASNTDYVGLSGKSCSCDHAKSRVTMT